MRILVTGGAGFVGAAATRAAVNAGHEVLNYDALTASGSLADIWDLGEAPNYTLVTGDICDPTLLGAVLSDFQPDAIFHCAAETLLAWPLDEGDRCYHTNVVGTQNLIDCAKNIQGSAPILVQLLHSKSDLFLSQAVKERLEQAERIVRNSEIPFRQLKTDLVFGIGQRHGNFLADLWFDRDYLDSDVSSHRNMNWVNVRDVAEAFLWAATGSQRGEPALTVGSGMDATPSQLKGILQSTSLTQRSATSSSTDQNRYDWVAQSDFFDSLPQVLRWIDSTLAADQGALQTTYLAANP